MLLALMVTSARAERRLAFVAGVNAYSNLPTNMQLERAVADAETVSTALQDLGFAVTKLTSSVTHETYLRLGLNADLSTTGQERVPGRGVA